MTTTPVKEPQTLPQTQILSDFVALSMPALFLAWESERAGLVLYHVRLHRLVLDLLDGKPVRCVYRLTAKQKILIDRVLCGNTDLDEARRTQLGAYYTLALSVEKYARACGIKPFRY
jgi:hypothetical protein